MVKVLTLFVASFTLISCANNAPVVNQESLAGVLVDSAKSQTNVIGRMRMDARVNTEMFDESGLKKTRLWFVAGSEKAVDRFISPISVHCESKGYKLSNEIEDKQYVANRLFPKLGPILAHKTRIFECSDQASVIRYAVLINDDDRESTVAGTVVAKVQVSAFENTKSLTSDEFRNRYINIHDELISQWDTMRGF